MRYSFKPWLLLLGAALVGCSADSTISPYNVITPSLQQDAMWPQTPTVFATGFLYPRGLAFGPDGALYVAEAGAAGTGTTDSTQCMQVPAPIGPYSNGPSARISRVDRRGNRMTFADGFPSAVNSVGDVMGVAAVAFVGKDLYALVAGGGCSHGVSDTPAGIARVGRGSWSMVADLSAWLAANPVAQPDPGDFEPDGAWYSMIPSAGHLVVVEPNHGEIDDVDPRTGDVHRILDVSASYGHIVPTAVAQRAGSLYFSNLGIFPGVQDSQNIYRLSASGVPSIVASGFTMVVGVDFDRAGRMYVLETSTVSGFPLPGTGRVTRIDRRGGRVIVVDGLTLPTAIAFGPDHQLYISNMGFGPPLPGEVLRVAIPDAEAGED
ncbi:MAG: ScyD/ScyE family protein [Gemmatimonadaceae bacterium]